MTGDDRLRTELEALERAAPPARPSRAARSPRRRPLALAASAGVVILAGVAIGVGLPDWLASLRPPGASPEATAPTPVGPVGPAEWVWVRYTIDAEAAHVHHMTTIGRRLIATGEASGQPAAWYSDDGKQWHRADVNEVRGNDAVRHLGPVYGAGDKLIAVGMRDGVTPIGYSSDDVGATWVAEPAFIWDEDPFVWGAGGRVTAVQEVPDGYLAVGTRQRPGWAIYLPRTTFWSSKDGLTWSPIDAAADDPGSLGPGMVAGATLALGSVFAYGSTGPPEDESAALWESPSGSSWHDVVRLPRSRGGIVLSLTDAVYERLGLLIAAGVVGDAESRRGVIWASDDGTNWVRRFVLDAPSEVRRAFEFDAETVLAVGRQDNVASLWIWDETENWQHVPLETERSRIDGTGIMRHGDALVVVGNLTDLEPGGVEVASEAVVWIGEPPEEPPVASVAPGPGGDLVPVPTSPPNPNGLCHQALLGGVLVRDPETGFAVQQDESRTAIRWPNGYVAREGPDGLELLDADGRVVAREGDAVRLGGGGDGDTFWTCSSPEVVPTTLTGTLMGDPNYEGGCVWVSKPDGQRWAIQWPEPYRLELSGEDAVLYSGDEVVGREGDQVTLRGTLGADFSYCGTSYDATQVIEVGPAP